MVDPQAPVVLCTAKTELESQTDDALSRAEHTLRVGGNVAVWVFTGADRRIGPAEPCEPEWWPTPTTLLPLSSCQPTALFFTNSKQCSACPPALWSEL